MTEKDIPIYISLISSIALFPVIAYYNKQTALLLFFAVFICAIAFHLRSHTEKYERMDFFPWNEANLVKKRHPNSTVIDCAWKLDQKKSDNIFQMSDPIIAEYDNVPSP
jgi:hypothetical protein